MLINIKQNDNFTTCDPTDIHLSVIFMFECSLQLEIILFIRRKLPEVHEDGIDGAGVAIAAEASFVVKTSSKTFLN